MCGRVDIEGLATSYLSLSLLLSLSLYRDGALHERAVHAAARKIIFRGSRRVRGGRCFTCVRKMKYIHTYRFTCILRRTRPKKLDVTLEISTHVRHDDALRHVQDRLSAQSPPEMRRGSMEIGEGVNVFTLWFGLQTHNLKPRARTRTA